MTATGDQVRRARLERGLSRAELAAATGVGERTIFRIETNNPDQPSTSRSIVKVENYLGLTATTDNQPDEDALLRAASDGKLWAELQRTPLLTRPLKATGRFRRSGLSAPESV